MNPISTSNIITSRSENNKPNKKNCVSFFAKFSFYGRCNQPCGICRGRVFKAQIQKRAQNLALLQQYNEPSLVEKTLSKYPQADAFVPLKANAVDMTVLIHKETAQVVKIVDLRPWKLN